MPLLLALNLFLGVAQAASPVASTTTASASVVHSCRLISTDNLAFGTYSPINGTVSSAQGQLSLACTKATAVSASPVSGGANLTGAGGSLRYGLYTNTAMSQVWGGPAVVTQTLNMYAGNGTSNIYFTQHATVGTLAACAALANNTVFVYNTNTSCAYGYGGGSRTDTALYGYALANGGNGLAYYNNGNPQILAGQQTSAFSTIYMPAGTVKVDAQNFTMAVARNGTTALTATAVSVNTPVQLPYYAQVPAGQDLVPGAYSDTVVVQVNF